MIKKIKAVALEVTAQLTFLKNENLPITEFAIKGKKIYDLASSEFLQFEKKFNFQNLTSEIEYFKQIKAEFLAHSFYFDKIIEIEKQKLFSPENEQIFIREKAILDYYKTSNIDFFNYFKSGETKFDSDYFSKENCSKSIFDTEINFIIPTEKEPKYDIVLAHFIANELLEIYLVNELFLSKLSKVKEIGIELTWSKPKAWLTELMYGLHYLECFNEGEISISNLTRIFNIYFNIDQGDAYHTFSKFKFRIESFTIFIDMLKEAILKKIEEDELKAVKKAKRS